MTQNTQPHIAQAKAMKAVFNASTPYVQFANNLQSLVIKSTVLIAHIPLPETLSQRPDHSALMQAAHNIGTALKRSRGFRVILLSYIPQPGSLNDLIKPILERVSGKTIGVDFGLAFQAQDTSDVALTTYGVIGISDKCTRTCLEAMLPESREGVDYVDLSTAELIPFWKVSHSQARQTLEAEMRRICETTGANFEDLVSVTSERFLPIETGDRQTARPKADDGPNMSRLNSLLRLIQDSGTQCPMIESLRFSNPERVKRPMRA